LRILNLGAGIQSTTVYLMMLRGEIPAADHAIFADTQEEPGAVMEHLRYLQSLNGPPIHVVTAGKLGDDLSRGENSTGQRFASIPAFTAKTEGGTNEGLLRRQCTKEYKLNPIEKFIRRELLGLPKGGRVKGQVHQVFGISLDEAGRAARITRNASKWQIMEFPLIEMRMTRLHCIEWLEAYGLPHKVPRSACVFCPYKNNAEWRKLRDEDPEGWNRAVEIDAALRIPGRIVNRGLNQKLFIHRSCKPLDQVDLSEKQHSLGFAVECKGMCGI
jgi:hypothetical protein